MGHDPKDVIDEINSSGFGYLQAEWEAFKAETGILPLNQADESRMKANWAKAKARVDANNANPNSSEKEKVYDFDVLSGQTMTYAFPINDFTYQMVSLVRRY